MADYFRKGKSLFSTTANTFSTGSGVTITPNSVTGLATDTEICLTFDRVDSAGTATPTKMERIIGTITGANFVVRTSPATGRGADGTSDAAHTSPVVEYIPNAKDMNDQVDGILIAHAQTGIHKSGATYAAPIFSGSVTGTYTLAGTPTITSPTISGAGGTAAGTLGYGATDHNLLVGDGTTNNPIHIGHWKTWSPSISGLTAGNGTLSAKYAQIGKSVLFNIHFTFGNSSAMVTTPVFSLPVNQKEIQYQGSGTFLDANTSQYFTSHVNIGNNNVYTYCIATAGAYAEFSGATSTLPFTWTTGDQIVITAFYEAE